MEIIDWLYQKGMIAVVRDFQLEQVEALSTALYAGGVEFIEFTLTNEAAMSAIRQMRATTQLPICIGAGSVVNTTQFQQVVEAGAQFVVTPILDEALIELALKINTPIISGAYTPTEIQRAYTAGATAVKVFPARSLGATFIKDVLAPLPHLKLIPTGGIDLHNLADFIQAGAWAVGVGSSMLDKNAIQQNNWQSITTLAHQFTRVFEEDSPRKER